MSKINAGLFSSNTPEWYTPPDLLTEIRSFYGGDYFDPCAQPDATTVVGLTGRENGLAIPWHGRVYCNPPYGREIGKWVRKAMTEPVDEIMLLVPARTETAWFQPLFDGSICFLRGRLKFQSPDRTSRPQGAPFNSALVYHGPRADAFAAAFAHRGVTMQACRTQRRIVTLWEVA